MAWQAPIFLTGFMASGKSTLGRALASAEPSVRFVDLDEAIEEAAGKSVSEIFADGGEEAFRQLESQVLRQQSRPGTVIACGGGTPCRSENVDFMHSAGTMVYLDATVDTIVRRLIEAPTGKRPLLEAFGADRDALAVEVRRMLAARAEAYSHADVVFDANRLDDEEQVAESVARFFTLFPTLTTHHGSSHTP